MGSKLIGCVCKLPIKSYKNGSWQCKGGLNLPAKDVMPAWKEDYINLFFEAYST